MDTNHRSEDLHCTDTTFAEVANGSFNPLADVQRSRTEQVFADPNFSIELDIQLVSDRVFRDVRSGLLRPDGSKSAATRYIAYQPTPQEYFAGIEHTQLAQGETNQSSTRAKPFVTRLEKILPPNQSAKLYLAS